jgi:hypothetical protein
MVLTLDNKNTVHNSSKGKYTHNFFEFNLNKKISAGHKQRFTINIGSLVIEIYSGQIMFIDKSTKLLQCTRPELNTIRTHLDKVFNDH